MANSAGLAPVLLALFILPLSSQTGCSDPTGPDVTSAASSTPAAAALAGMHDSDPRSNAETDCEAHARSSEEIEQARAYVIETASPGYTMSLQGPELAIGRLHPEFVVRLAKAIREARDAGLRFAGVFSAYRPPAFGVGGFSDKFNSLHTYGLAVDMEGIGRPGSPEAQLWHEIAARNGVVCPYGPRNRAEWNHCQPTSVKVILAEHPLRDTVTASGPFNLASMFEVGNAMIESVASAADSLSRADPRPAHAAEATAGSREGEARPQADRKRKQTWRPTTARVAPKSARHAKIAARGPSRWKATVAVRARGKVAAKATVAVRAKGKVAAEAGRRKSKSRDG